MASEDGDDCGRSKTIFDRRLRLGSSTSKTLDRTIPQPILPPLLFAPVSYGLVCHEEGLQDEFATLVVVV
jgi:hypothetical protein